MPLEPVSFNGRNWLPPGLVVPETGHPPFACDRVDRQPSYLLELLRRRGISQGPDMDAFLAPSLQAMLDPQAMAQMDVAVERLTAAVLGQHRVMVWGDYDVDGVCATSILISFFRQIGLPCNYYIPDRRSEGYGLNIDGITEVASSHQLLVTVDCGSTQTDELAHAKRLGLDTIVVDHHQVPDTLPSCTALINPQRTDCGYADKGLCAAGLAFMVAVAVRRGLRQRGFFRPGRPEPDLRPLLDLVATATVADMVPLTGVNRMLVHVGLERMRRQPRLGLLALCQVAKVAVSHVTAQDLGYRIGPRINARGRMEHAGLAVELMLTEDEAEAQSMAQALNEANLSRRALEKRVVDEAIAQVAEQGRQSDAVLVVHHPQWHAGVLGLVASRLTARFFRPAVVIGEGGKGSARSIPSVNLHSCLQAAATTMERFGGHPAAAGLTIAQSNIAALRVILCDEVTTLLGAPPYIPKVQPDLQVGGHFMTPSLFEQLHALAPFGQSNPEPMLAAFSQPIVERRLVGEEHLKLRLGRRGYEAIAFGMGALLPQLGSHIDVLFFLERHVYQGNARLQMRIYDLRTAAM